MAYNKQETTVSDYDSRANEAGSRARSQLTNACWNTAYVVTTMGISFVVTPVPIYHLGISLYEGLMLVWFITGILGIMSFRLGEAAVRYEARYHGDKDIDHSGVTRPN